ncbi:MULTISPECIES: glycine betaine uptake BCCT transporter [Pontibacillus]|uniref:BCCT family transporter n=1 Tax=Pontibacillus chungwhensis TaxID=265426 RepID=A0ABY8V3M8_9BACI|nr:MULTISPECIES: BCCT family transporter [Pontibacillus]MCD5325338.1 BCCT family transporter [Pontibacillus sp. HN14]WIF98456.1 BCCT family transporter [Pontibacillus chungwhensis]
MNKVTPVFWISLAISAVFVLWGTIAPGNLETVSGEIQGFLTDKFGWFYLLTVAIFLIFSIYLVVSPYGKLKLGQPNEKPEYNTITWFAMLFSAGMGIGLVFWGSAEPLAHFATPPTGDAETTEAAKKALRYAFFHWGFHVWAIYTVIALAIGYFKFRRKAPGVISATFEPLLGEKATKGALGTVIDVIAVFATIFGVATSLGLGATQIAGGLAYITPIENNKLTQFVIIAIVTVLFMISAWSGLSKGIKYLSNTNIVLAIGLIAMTLILGPTVFIMNTFTTTLGSYIQNLPMMTFQMAPLSSDQNDWIQGWTVFYWAWFISWSPFVGTFIARVSKGRTIREFIMGVLLGPSIFSAFWFAVFGGTSLKQALDGNTSLIDLPTEQALFGTFEGLPMGIILTIIGILLISTFFITSADSATFVLGMQTTNGSLNPPNVVKLSWGVIQAATAAVLLGAGGLNALQTAAIVSAFPFAFILLFMCWSLLIALNQDAKAANIKKNK